MLQLQIHLQNQVLQTQFLTIEKNTFHLCHFSAEHLKSFCKHWTTQQLFKIITNFPKTNKPSLKGWYVLHSKR